MYGYVWKVGLGPYYWKHMIHTRIKEGFGDSKGWSGKIAWLDTMIRESVYVPVNLLVVAT